MRFYQSKSQLEKKFAQAESKLQLCEKRSVVARNEYILSLSALNAHQERYYVTDIPSLMQVRTSLPVGCLYHITSYVWHAVSWLSLAD